VARRVRHTSIVPTPEPHVYRTCLFCEANLGENDMLESMPIGRRIAFDREKGRVWVVCRSCERWNLAPLEERWETIEDGERRFRATRVRVSTDNIGLAKLPDGTELVRIGKPLRPEFAAWRYGDQFGRRRRRAIAAGSVGAVAAVAAAPVAVPAAVAAFWSIGGVFSVGWFAGGAQLPYQMAKDWVLSERVIARLPIAAGGVDVRVRHLKESVLRHDGDELAIDLKHDGGSLLLTGAMAQRGLGILLARSNVWGASAAQVRAAVHRIGERGDVSEWLQSASRLSGRPGGRVMAKIRKVGALGLTPVERLAVEMAMHEDAERRVLEGELAHLAQAWESAEQIAAIADHL
jgi:hypothetical protein